MSKALVIYHANCADGFGAAWAARGALGDMADYIPCQYGQPAPTIEPGQEVYIVDFSFPRDVMLTIGEKAASVMVLDHHKTARDALAGEWPTHIRITFDMERSGARMAWEAFHPGTAVPKLIQYIEDRDLWRWQLPNSREVSAAIRSYPFNFDIWNDFQIERLAAEGAAIIRYTTQQIGGLVSLAQRREVGGHTVPVVNAPACWASEVCNILAQGEPFAASWCASETEVFWSLRSAEDGIDVSEVAKQFGGGGHKHAAGFKTERLA